MKLLSAAIILGLALGVLAGQGPGSVPLMQADPWGSKPPQAAAIASVPARISAAAAAESSSAGAAMPVASLLHPLWKNAAGRDGMMGETEPALAVRAARKPLPDRAAGDRGGAAPVRSEGEGWTILLAALVAVAFVARRRIFR